MKRCFKRALAMGLVSLLLVQYVSNSALADPGTYVEVVPSSFVGGQGSCTIFWDYDYEHDTIIWADGPSGLIQIVHRSFPGNDRNSYPWDGKDEQGQLVDEGWYTITVEPQDEWSDFARSDSVYVYAPPPPPPPWHPFGPVFTSDEETFNLWALNHIILYGVSASVGYRSPAQLYYSDEGDTWLRITTPTGSMLKITGQGELSSSVPAGKDTDVEVGFGPLDRSVHYAISNHYAFPEEQAESSGEDFYFDASQEIKHILQAKPWVSDAIAVAAFVAAAGVAVWYCWPLLVPILSGAAVLEAPADGLVPVDRGMLRDLTFEEPDDTLHEALATVMGPAFAHCCELIPLGVPESVYAGESFAVTGVGFSSGAPMSLAVGLSGVGSPSATASVFAGQDGSFAAGLSLPVDAAAGDYLVFAFDDDCIKTALLEFGESGGAVPLHYVVGAAYLTVEQDTVPPTTEAAITPEYPDGRAGWYVTLPSVSLLATDEELGVAETKFRLDGGVWTNFSGPLTLENGIHVLDYYSVDLAGNSEPAQTATILVDTTPPEVGCNGAGVWANAPACVTVTSDDALSGTDFVFLETTAGIRSETLASPLEVEFTHEGFYEFEYGASDIAGNVAPTLRSWLALDYGPPVIEAVPDKVPNAQGWYNVPVTVSFVATDPGLADGHVGSGVSSVSDPIVVDWEGAAISVEGLATDRAGNLGAASVDLNVDLTPPTVALTMEGGPDFTDDSTLKFSIQAEDVLSGVMDISIFVDGVLWEGDGIDLWRLPLGPHTLVLCVTDRAGNSSMAEAAFTTRATILSLVEVKHILANLGWLGTSPGTTRSLDATLEAAQAAAERGHARVFENIMRAFIKEVRALERTRITAEAAGILVRDAEFLIANGAGI